jgi:hypothetical protein
MEMPYTRPRSRGHEHSRTPLLTMVVPAIIYEFKPEAIQKRDELWRGVEGGGKTLRLVCEWVTLVSGCKLKLDGNAATCKEGLER